MATDLRLTADITIFSDDAEVVHDYFVVDDCVVFNDAHIAEFDISADPYVFANDTVMSKGCTWTDRGRCWDVHEVVLFERTKGRRAEAEGRSPIGPVA